jgi:hypothetical protein
MEFTTYTLDFNGEDIDVTGTYIEGFAGSYFDAPEPDLFEIDTIYFKDVDVTALMENEIEYLETQILDLYYR